MSIIIMSTKFLDLGANSPVTPYQEYQGRSFLYIRAPTTPAGVQVGITFGTSTPNGTNSFFLKAGEIWSFKGEFVPTQQLNLCANMDCVMCVASDMPTT